MLGERLREEWSGILAWMIRQFLEWQRIGLAPPPAVSIGNRGLFGSGGRALSVDKPVLRTGPRRAWARSGELYGSWKK